jgi:hypothetical protein
LAKSYKPQARIRDFSLILSLLKVKFIIKILTYILLNTIKNPPPLSI